MSDADASAPGWDAIDAVLGAQYGDQEPQQVGSTLAYDGGGHWHYVGCGLSELFEPVPGANPAVSGWGFELTMRVPRDGDDPPGWPFRMLEEIAQYVNGNRAVLAPGTGWTSAAGDRVPRGRGRTRHRPHGLRVRRRPVSAIDTPNGRVVFLQAVGVTAAEHRMVAGQPPVLAGLGDPLLRTDPSRA